MALGESGRTPLFGVLRTDGVTTPLPPIVNVLEETVRLLRFSGVEVVEISKRPGAT